MSRRSRRSRRRRSRSRRSSRSHEAVREGCWTLDHLVLSVVQVQLRLRGGAKDSLKIFDSPETKQETVCCPPSLNRDTQTDSASINNRRLIIIQSLQPLTASSRVRHNTL